jgi:RecA-family ATPase
LSVAENVDANDVERLLGLDHVRQAFEARRMPWGDEPPLAGEEQEEPSELPGCVDPAEWSGQQAPYRRFIIQGWIVRGAAGLLSGEEGVGKSLLAQQMATCAALGRSFLGLDIAPVKAIYITCEDPIDELWRRQEAINKALGVSMEDLGGRLMLTSLTGEIGNELGTFDDRGRLSPSVRFEQIRARAVSFGANLAFLDNAAHFFAGNENARHDVAAFLGLLERLSIAIDGAVILLAHPNKQHAQGNKQGNEYSGSTGWSAHVRNRLFLDWAKTDADGMPIGDDGRLLRKSKANYGKKGEELHFQWFEWAFREIGDIPPNVAAEMAATAQAGHENDVFLHCLDQATKERRPTSASNAAANFAPRVFAKMPTAKNMPAEALERALQRLLLLGEIVGDAKLWQRPNRTWVIGLARCEEAV